MLGGIVALLVISVQSVSSERRHVHSPAFDFELRDINPASPTHGDTVRLSDLYRHGGLLVNFIASWCGPCGVELPLMQALHAAGEVLVVCVAADEVGGAEDVLPLVRRSGVTMPVLFASEEEARTLALHYDYTFLPATYLIDASGLVRTVFEGIVDEHSLREELAKHLR